MAGETILVVEDEPLVGIELQEWLTDLGYFVPRVVADGSQVSEATRDIRPDLVLMDIRIKGPLDGVQAAGLLRQTSDVPILFLSAYSDSETVARVSKVQSNGMLLKPFREKELEINVALALQKTKEEQKTRKKLLPWFSIVDGLEQALALFDQDGRWLHGNQEAAKCLYTGPEETTLATLLCVSSEEWALDPLRWTGREYPLGDSRPDWVFTVEEFGTETRRDGFLVNFHPMVKQERAHLQSSIQAIHSLVSGFVPEPNVFQERLSNHGFLIPRPSGTGDFYDLFPVGPHHFLFYSLDVSGHGILSSMTVLTLRGMIRELARNALVRTKEVPSSAELVDTLNQRYLSSNPEGPMFTLTLGILTPISGEVRLVRAGHPAPLIQGQDGYRQIGAEGPALGVFPEVELQEVTDRLRPGERMFLVSDGILERLGDRSLYQGMEVLKGLVRGRGDLEEKIRAVREACLATPGLPADDLSLLALEPKLW